MQANTAIEPGASELEIAVRIWPQVTDPRAFAVLLPAWRAALRWKYQQPEDLPPELMPLYAKLKQSGIAASLREGGTGLADLGKRAVWPLRILDRASRPRTTAHRVDLLIDELEAYLDHSRPPRLRAARSLLNSIVYFLAFLVGVVANRLLGLTMEQSFAIMFTIQVASLLMAFWPALRDLWARSLSRDMRASALYVYLLEEYSKQKPTD